MTNREAEQVLEVDRHNPKIMRSLRRAPRYRKVGKVQITIARGQEQITTRFTDGRLETTDIAKRGDGIVTNPGGEQYIIDPTEMTVTYSLKRGQRKPQPGETRTYVDKGQIRSRRNPYKRKITMMASWGYMQNGGADAMLADTYNPKTRELRGEPYIIDATAFRQTYRAVNPLRRLFDKFYPLLHKQG